jgi:hypothetical protein
LRRFGGNRCHSHDRAPFAAQRGKHEDVEALAEAGANVNARTSGGLTPLIMAAFMGCGECVRLLLEFGADAAIRTAKGEAALDVATEQMNKAEAEERARFAKVVQILLATSTSPAATSSALSSDTPSGASAPPGPSTMPLGADDALLSESSATSERGLVSRLAAAHQCARQIGQEMRRAIDASGLQPSGIQALTMAEDLAGASHAYLQLLADAFELDRHLAGVEQARDDSVRDDLRRQASELGLEPVQERMLAHLLRQPGSTCSLLSQISMLAEKQRRLCVRFEAEMESLNVTTSIEEEWRDTANQRDMARRRYINLQELYLHGLRSWQRQLRAAITEAEARLRSFRALASQQQTRSHRLPKVINVDPLEDLDALFSSVRSVVQACKEAFATQQAESGVVAEEKRIADLSDLLRARAEEIPTAVRELELQRRLHANRVEAACALCELRSINVDLKVARRHRNAARTQMEEAIDELPSGDIGRQQKEDVYKGIAAEHEVLARACDAHLARIVRLSAGVAGGAPRADATEAQLAEAAAFPELPLCARWIMHAKAAHTELSVAEREKWDMQTILMQAGILAHDRSCTDSYVDHELVHGKPHVQKARLHNSPTEPPAWKVLKEYGMADFKLVNKAICAAAKLKHPGIVPVECAFLEPSKPVVVVQTRWFEGGNLRAWCADKDDGARLRAAQRISDAVGFLHANGLLHRDVRPAKIVLINKHAGAAPMLCDFDLSIDSGRAKTLTGMAGTQLYAAVFDATPSEAADVFSLGMTLEDLFLCAGNHNLLQSWCGGSSHALTDPLYLHQLREDLSRGDVSHPDIAARVRRCRRGVLETLSKMLARDAHERPTAREVAERLSHVLGERACSIC